MGMTNGRENKLLKQGSRQNNTIGINNQGTALTSQLLRMVPLQRGGHSTIFQKLFKIAQQLFTNFLGFRIRLQVLISIYRCYF